jgi:uncharacterized membrane protein YGL010W
VPCLLFTVLVWITPYKLPVTSLPFTLDAGMILSSIYILYYLTLEPTAALLYIPFLILLNFAATQFTSIQGADTYAVYLHVGSWVMQFIGHGVFEGMGRW